ncbi:MAG: hypothetical protein QOG89_2801 [Thermomicrobiales bacterium]|nr:hypothetical protein [Thermomicrobiales bacterium]
MRPDGVREKWTTPPRHAPRESGEAARSPGASTSRRPTPRPASRAQPVDPERPVVLGFAIAPAVTGVVALLLAFGGPLRATGAVPFGLVFLCGLQIVGYLATRHGEAAILARSWLIALLTTAGLLPLVSLQASVLREPYVAMSRHSATPALIASMVVVLFLVVVAAWCVVAFSSVPEAAAMAFTPLALLVPGVLGIEATIDQRAALEALAVSSLFAAGVTVLAWSLPRGARSAIPPIALVVQVVVLWAAGRGPSFPETSGRIVDVLYWVTLLLTAVLVFGVPVAAARLKQAIATLEDAERPRRSGADEGVPLQ